MVRTLLIGVDGSIEVIDKKEGLEASQALVEGDIETILYNPSAWCLVGNESGKLHAQMKKEGFENNEIGRRFVAEMKGCSVDEIVSLHGPMFLVGLNDEGDFVDVPKDAEESLRAYEGITEPDLLTPIREPQIMSFSTMAEYMEWKNGL
jgi:hypothetical protein|tara:strand:+ start:15290 stop:15736 length:447 start_codon:yes stop_codon:yes gene_type:complete